MLEGGRGAWNSRCSGEMRRYREEHLWLKRRWTTSDAEARKLGEQTGLDTLVVPSPKRWMLGVIGTQSDCAVANALSIPPGEYGRKAETQRNMTGARTSGGACGSIRRNAKDLTWARESTVDRGRNIPFRKNCCGGAAWLSSARVVRCWVKSRNTSATLIVSCQRSYAGHSSETASDNGEEGGDDVKSSWPLCPGLHTCYNGRYKPSQTREGELIGKSRASDSDWSLQLDSMKLEVALVIADQHAAVNTFPGLVHTARHITKVELALEAGVPTRKGSSRPRYSS